jgi:diguanylate cyclase (GGDEF)-like protein
MLGLDEATERDDPEEWFGRVPHEDLPALKGAIEAHLRGETASFENEHRMVHEDGSHRWMLSRGLAVKDAGGTAVRMAGSLRDVTTGKIVDPLTGLPNKLLLADRLQRALQRGRRKKGDRFAVLLLDLDRFKMINDGLGHALGDRLLIEVARRLEGCIRATDTVGRIEGESTLARLGGDEFMLLLEEVRQPADARAVADRIHEQLERPFDLGGEEVTAKASIGIVTAKAEYGTAEEVLRDADTAMNRAKARGGGISELFESGMHGHVLARLRLENDLRKALERNEMRLHYQPIVSLESGRIVAFESLVRWEHPRRGLLAPAEFIPLAEETGLIVPLGRWILACACRQAGDWQSEFPRRPPLIISSNLCAGHLAEPDLLDGLSRALEVAGLEPESLKLEITESMIIEDPEGTAATLARIRAKGISLAIDDFGTGYSSLTYLHEFPIDTLKIDRSFIGRIDSEQRGLEIVRTIMNLAHNLRMDVIAEGVETKLQASLLRELGCEYAQGFLFSKPVEAATAASLLSAGILGDGCLSSRPAAR